ncbi:hypothetical protein BJ742DRAFT_368227 [Cladochytrium replicatum]|nr:hypothetical protein BJ742DRAFT_368227 [Cladochytrium replicatum]
MIPEWPQNHASHIQLQAVGVFDFGASAGGPSAGYYGAYPISPEDLGSPAAISKVLDRFQQREPLDELSQAIESGMEFWENASNGQRSRPMSQHASRRNSETGIDHIKSRIALHYDFNQFAGNRSNGPSGSSFMLSVAPVSRVPSARRKSGMLGALFSKDQGSSLRLRNKLPDGLTGSKMSLDFGASASMANLSTIRPDDSQRESTAKSNWDASERPRITTMYKGVEVVVEEAPLTMETLAEHEVAVKALDEHIEGVSRNEQKKTKKASSSLGSGNTARGSQQSSSMGGARLKPKGGLFGSSNKLGVASVGIKKSINNLFLGLVGHTQTGVQQDRQEGDEVDGDRDEQSGTSPELEKRIKRWLDAISNAEKPEPEPIEGPLTAQLSVLPPSYSASSKSREGLNFIPIPSGPRNYDSSMKSLASLHSEFSQMIGKGSDTSSILLGRSVSKLSVKLLSSQAASADVLNTDEEPEQGQEMATFVGVPSRLSDKLTTDDIESLDSASILIDVPDIEVDQHSQAARKSEVKPPAIMIDSSFRTDSDYQDLSPEALHKSSRPEQRSSTVLPSRTGQSDTLVRKPPQPVIQVQPADSRRFSEPPEIIVGFGDDTPDITVIPPSGPPAIVVEGEIDSSENLPGRPSQYKTKPETSELSRQSQRRTSRGNDGRNESVHSRKASSYEANIITHIPMTPTYGSDLGDEFMARLKAQSNGKDPGGPSSKPNGSSSEMPTRQSPYLPQKTGLKDISTVVEVIKGFNDVGGDLTDKSGMDPSTLKLVIGLKRWQQKSDRMRKGKAALLRPKPKLLEEFTKRAFTELPDPLRTDLITECEPILQTITEAYRSTLGDKHKFTMESQAHLDKLMASVRSASSADDAAVGQQQEHHFTSGLVQNVIRRASMMTRSLENLTIRGHHRPAALREEDEEEEEEEGKQTV